MGCGESKESTAITVLDADAAGSGGRIPNLIQRKVSSNIDAIHDDTELIDATDPDTLHAVQEDEYDDDLGGTDSSFTLDDGMPNAIYNSDLGESLDLRRGGLSGKVTGSASSHVMSAMSYDSADSGVYELEDEYSFVITEFSSPELIAKVESEFQSPSEQLDLTILGTACKRLLSGQQRVRMEEKEVLETLRNQGLLTVNSSKKPGCVSFEIVDASGRLNDSIKSEKSLRSGLTSAGSGGVSNSNLPPLRLQSRLEARRRQHLREVSTHFDIEEKLEKAEERRKQLEEEKIRKLNTDRLVEKTAKVEEMHQEKVHKANELVETAEEKRESRLKELRDRLKEKHKKVAQARLKAMTQKEILGPVPKPILQGVSGPKGVMPDQRSGLRPALKVGDDFFDD